MQRRQNVGWWWCWGGKNHLVNIMKSGQYQAQCNSYWLPMFNFPPLAWAEENKGASYCEKCLKGIAATNFSVAHPGRETTPPNLTGVVKIRG